MSFLVYGSVFQSPISESLDCMLSKFGLCRSVDGCVRVSVILLGLLRRS